MFKFEAACFYSGDTKDEAEEYISEENMRLIEHIKNNHPELAHWSVVAVDCAWGSYSRNIYAVGHVDWIQHRDTAFLAYCYVCQLNPDFDWGGTGLYDSDVTYLGELTPWVMPITESTKNKLSYWKFH